MLHRGAISGMDGWIGYAWIYCKTKIVHIVNFRQKIPDGGSTTMNSKAISQLDGRILQILEHLAAFIIHSSTSDKLLFLDVSMSEVDLKSKVNN